MVTQRAYEECKEAPHGGDGAADVGLALTVGIAVFEYFHSTIAASVADDIVGDNDDTNGKDKEFPIIVLVVIGIVVLLIIIGLIIFIYSNRRKMMKRFLEE